MRFFHLGDLHIGKRLGEFSLIDDQEAILEQIVTLAVTHKPDAVVLAGDIYDKSIPSGEAVTLFDDFLTALAGQGMQVLIVSGNHDSPERLHFGSRLMTQNGVHLAGLFSGHLQRVVLEDDLGPVHFYLMPFLKPAMLNPWYADQQIDGYEEAVRTVIRAADLDPTVRQVLVAHQFITSNGREPERSDSETVAIGGLDQIDASVFDAFDYVALGHLHGPQSIGRETVRYAGSPLKYSFSEAHHRKSVVQVDLGRKGDVQLSLLPLTPVRDMREIRGPLEALLEAARAEIQTSGSASGDFIRAVLTDEGPVYDAIGQLRLVYPNLMRIDFENSRTSTEGPSRTAASGDVSRQSPLDLFAEFYANQNGGTLTDEQTDILTEIFERVGGAGR